MQVLHVVGRSHRRGAEQVAFELAEELERRGHGNHLVAVSLGHDGDEIHDLPVLVRTAHQRPHHLWTAARALRPVLRDRDPDVVLAHGAAATLVAVLASPRRGPAIVFQTIVGMAPQSFAGVQRLGWRLAVRRIDGVVALTTAMGEEVVRLGYRGPVWSIPNARRAERFSGLDRNAESARLRDELGLAGATALIGLVGYLVDQKRPERAVELLAGLRERDLDVHLVVAGTGPLGELVEQRAESLGVSDRVSMIGHRDDVPQVLAGLDLLVLTSDDEGIPGIVVEAAMAGCPVVTFPLGGVAEVVADGVSGRVLDAPSVPALVDATAELIADGDRRRAMSAAALARSSQWAMETVAARYETHLGSLVSPRLAGARGLDPEEGRA